MQEKEETTNSVGGTVTHNSLLRHGHTYLLCSWAVNDKLNFQDCCPGETRTAEKLNNITFLGMGVGRCNLYICELDIGIDLEGMSQVYTLPTA